MHCRKMFKAEIPFSNVMTCEDDDKVGDSCLSIFKPITLYVCMHVWTTTIVHYCE